MLAQTTSGQSALGPPHGAAGGGRDTSALGEPLLASGGRWRLLAG